MNFHALPDEALQQASFHQNWNSTRGLPYYLTPPLSSIHPSFSENSIYDYGATRAVNESPGAQPDGIALDRQDQPLSSHPFDSRCKYMQHERSGTDSFESRCLVNKLAALD